MFLGRASDGDIDARVRRRAMEFTWRGSDTLGAAADVKGMLLSKYGNYGPPRGTATTKRARTLCGRTNRR